MLIGIGLGVGLSRSMTVIMYGVEIGDPVVYGAIVLTLSVAGLLACFVPARAATRTDVLTVMRGE